MIRRNQFYFQYEDICLAPSGAYPEARSFLNMFTEAFGALSQ